MKITKKQLKQIIKEELNENEWDPEGPFQGRRPWISPGEPVDPTGVFRDLYDAWTPKTPGERAYKDQLGEKLGFRTYETDDPSGYSGGTRTTISPEAQG